MFLLCNIYHCVVGHAITLMFCSESCVFPGNGNYIMY